MEKDYKKEYLEDFIGLTGITDLTIQDVYGAMEILVRKGELERKSKSLWSRWQFNHLYRKMMDADGFYNQTLHDFREAVEETRAWRHRNRKDVHGDVPKKYTRPQQERPDEDDMDFISAQLLRDDDIFYGEEED